MTHTDEISFEEHCRFLRNLIDNNTCWYVAVYENDMLLATLNYTLKQHGEWERGIIVAPVFRGKHIAGQIESILYPMLKQKGVKCLSAKVKKNNSRSLRYHESIGYSLRSQDSDYCYYTKNI